MIKLRQLQGAGFVSRVMFLTIRKVLRSCVRRCKDFARPRLRR